MSACELHIKHTFYVEPYYALYSVFSHRHEWFKPRRGGIFILLCAFYTDLRIMFFHNVLKYSSANNTFENMILHGFVPTGVVLMKILYSRCHDIQLFCSNAFNGSIVPFGVFVHNIVRSLHSRHKWIRRTFLTGATRRMCACVIPPETCWPPVPNVASMHAYTHITWTIALCEQLPSCIRRTKPYRIRSWAIYIFAYAYAYENGTTHTFAWDARPRSVLRCRRRRWRRHCAPRKAFKSSAIK